MADAPNAEALETPPAAPPPAANPAQSEKVAARGPAPAPEIGGDPEADGYEARENGWGETWRDDFAGDDASARKMLDRFTDPRALVKKIINQEKVIRSRKDTPARPGPDATQEELSQWREQMGLPAEPSGYIENLKLSDGKQLGDSDLPLAEAFAGRMHEIGASQEVINEAVDVVLGFMEEEQSEKIIQDEQFKRSSRDHLRDEWGGDFKANLNAISTVFEDRPDVLNKLLSGRTGEGRLIGDDPDVVMWLADIALQINPEAKITSGGNPTSVSTINEEIDSLKKMSADQAGPYWRGSESKKHQGRMAELVTMRERLSARQRA